MSGAKYFVWGGERWREVDSSSGAVAGWARRARFVYVRRGRLRVARNTRVLAALRALALGQPSAASAGPRLSKYSKEVTAARSRSRSRRRSPVPHCSHHHHCCGHYHGCNNDHNRSVPAELPQRCDVAIQHAPRVDISLQNDTTDELVARTAPTEPPKSSAPVLDSLLERPTPTNKRRSDTTSDEHFQKVKKRTRVAVKPKRKETREAARSTDRSSTSEEVCKELTISESDVAALRSFVARTRAGALERFDADLSYRRALFYAINPLVSVPRCQHTARALREHSALPHFAARLGLRPHRDRDKENAQRPIPDQPHTAPATRDNVRRAERAVLDKISPSKRNVAPEKTTPRKTFDSDTSDDSEGGNSKRNSLRSGTRRPTGSVVLVSSSDAVETGRKRSSFRPVKLKTESNVSMENSDSDYQHETVPKSKQKKRARPSRGKPNITVEESDETESENSSSDSESDLPLVSNRRDSHRNIKIKRNDSESDASDENEDFKENKKVTQKKSATRSKSVTGQETDHEGKREAVGSEERRVSLRKRPTTLTNSSRNDTIRASSRHTGTRNKSYIEESSSESRHESSPTITLARSKSVENPPRTPTKKSSVRVTLSGPADKGADSKPQTTVTIAKRDHRGRFLKLARRRIVTGNTQTQTSNTPASTASTSQKQASSSSQKQTSSSSQKQASSSSQKQGSGSPQKQASSSSHKQVSSGSNALQKQGSSGSNASHKPARPAGSASHKQGSGGSGASEQHTHTISKRASASNMKEYSNLEDHAIVAWVSGGARARKVNGNKLWRELQDSYLQLTGRNRSWHSLRNRYLRYILPALGALRLPPADESRLRAAAATGEIKHKRNGVTSQGRRNSIFKEAPVKAASARRLAPLASSPPASPTPSPPPSPTPSPPASPAPTPDATDDGVLRRRSSRLPIPPAPAPPRTRKLFNPNLVL